MTVRQLIILITLALPLSVEAGTPARTWEFSLTTPGTYEVHVKHEFKGAVVPRGSKATYLFQTQEKTIKRDFPFYQRKYDHPEIMLIGNITSPQTVSVAITGIPQPFLQQTCVYVVERNSRYLYEWYDPGKSVDLVSAKVVRHLLQQPEKKIDLARTKLTIDKLIDPTVDIDANLKRIGAMVANIKAMPGYGNSSLSKVQALKRYVYEPGEWNNHQAYHYDMDDPLGTKISNKILSNYMTFKQGNCVTMPLLLVILGQRLGIDVTASTAPLHVLVKYRDEMTDIWINLEATSGANPARDVWYRKQMPMTDQALANGVYLQPLTIKETVAVMATTLAEHYFARREFEKAITISDLVLEHYPNYVNAMIRKGSAYYRLMEKYYLTRYRSPDEVPIKLRGHFAYLSRNNMYWFAKAEALGWRQPSEEDEKQYLQQVNNDHQKVMNQ